MSRQQDNPPRPLKAEDGVGKPEQPPAHLDLDLVIPLVEGGCLRIDEAATTRYWEAKRKAHDELQDLIKAKLKQQNELETELKELIHERGRVMLDLVTSRQLISVLRPTPVNRSIMSLLTPNEGKTP